MCPWISHSGDVILQSDGRLSVYISCLCQSSEVHILHSDSHTHRCLYLVPPWLLLTGYVCFLLLIHVNVSPFPTHLSQVLQYQLGHCSWHTFQQLSLSHPRLHHIPLLGLSYPHICRLWWHKCTQCTGDGVCISHTTHWNHVVWLLPWSHCCYPHECSQLQVQCIINVCSIHVYMCMYSGYHLRRRCTWFISSCLKTSWEKACCKGLTTTSHFSGISSGNVEQIQYIHTDSDIYCCDLISFQGRNSPWGSRFNARHASHSETGCIDGRVFQPPVKGSLLPTCWHLLSSPAL